MISLERSMKVLLHNNVISIILCKREEKMNTEISQLIHFALTHHLISEEDIDYSVNQILDILQMSEFSLQNMNDDIDNITFVLEKILDYAQEKQLISCSIVERDLLDTRIMNCVMPRPSEVVKRFYELYQLSCQKATDYYYQLSIDSQYIRKNRTDKNIRFKQYYKYAHMEITINLSKPEKDPKEIAKEKLIKASSYPQCLLCKENVGFAGDYKRAARQTHRIIPVILNHQKYYLQYSPYVYYDEHCIVFNEVHKPMKIYRDTFKNLLSFIQQFPHYMLGSNADLPIVGGSILSHDHYQGGCYHFPIEDALVIKEFVFEKYPYSKIELLKWPLSTIRITSKSQQEIIDFADEVLEKWKLYSNKDLGILSHTQQVSHNTITPIARMKDQFFQMDLVLRNNRTTSQYPDGIFHPHAHLHHIKKENIGLIEVMGLAILPARLKDEIAILKKSLLNEEDISKYPFMDKHKVWYNELKQDFISKENIDDILKISLTKKFVHVLENAGVFKMNEEGIEAFIHFIESLE
jgi:Galactose-1-phosphate uridyltransferase